VFVVLQKMFYMRISEFSLESFAIFEPEIFISTHTKDCIYIKMAQIRQNLIFFSPDFYNMCQHFTKYIEGCLNVLTFISSL
jgi:hypothetical protein